MTDLSSLSGLFYERYWRSFRAQNPHTDEAKARSIFDAFKGLSLSLSDGLILELLSCTAAELAEAGRTALADQDRRLESDYDA